MAPPPSARPSAPRAWGIVTTCTRDPLGLGADRGLAAVLDPALPVFCRCRSTMSGAPPTMALPSRREPARRSRGMPVHQMTAAGVEPGRSRPRRDPMTPAVPDAELLGPKPYSA